MSDSGRFCRFAIGIGGRIASPFGLTPVRIVFLKSASVHDPMPVSLSGVRLRARVTPHGPRQAVSSMLVDTPPTTCGASGAFSGCPMNDFEKSIEPSWFFGVWQSWHPPSMTS